MNDNGAPQASMYRRPKKNDERILDTRKKMEEKIEKKKKERGKERGTKISFSISCLNRFELRRRPNS